MTPYPADALAAALHRYHAASPGSRADAAARAAVAAALQALAADGHAVALGLDGRPYVTRPAPGRPRVPAALLAIAGTPEPLPLADAPAPTPTPAPLAAEGPLTPAELAALSAQGWVHAGEDERGRVTLAQTHEPGWPHETRTPGGWRALL